MRFLFLAISAAASVAAPDAGAAAAPGIQEAPTHPSLLLRPKAAIPTPAKGHHFAPFMAPQQEPDLDLLPRSDLRQESSRSSCGGERSLCYDPGSGRIVYKPARALMPDLPGFRRENISVRRDRVTFRYSF